jgi:hypothetical protein
VTINLTDDEQLLVLTALHMAAMEYAGRAQRAIDDKLAKQFSNRASKARELYDRLEHAR